MILSAIVLLIMAIILLAFGIRGRVIQHGAFCNECRFDLQGLGSDAHACPECGSDMRAIAATRPTLRQRRPVVLTVGVLLLLSGLVLTGIVASNNTSRVMAVLPTSVVFTLHDLGVDAAFTEIATNRLTSISPLSDQAWDELIDAALTHQANFNAVWDPRHGEVLYVAFSRGRLNADQAEQYLKSGLEIYAEFQQEARHGANEIGVTLVVTSSGRFGGLTGSLGSAIDGTDTVWNRIGITAGGIVHPEHEVPLNTAGFTSLHVPGTGGGGRGSMAATISLEGLDWDSVEPGVPYSFFIRYDVRVQRMSDDFVHYRTTGTIEQPVRVLPSNADIISLETDPDILAQFADHPAVRLGPMHIVPKDERRVSEQGTHFASIEIVCENLPAVVAGQVVVVFDEQDYEIGEVGLSVLSGYGLSGLSGMIREPLTESIIDAMLEAGSVTIEIHPDARQAERMPGVESILGLPLRFEDITVTDEPRSTTQTSMAHPDQRVGRVVTEPEED